MSKPTICGQIGLMLVIAVSILPAWWFGSVAARDVMWIFWASIAALICCQLPAVRELRFPALTIPLLLGALIGLLQLAPLSRGVHADASPTGAKLWASLVPANSPVGEGGETKLRDRVGLAPVAAAFPISLYPASTRRDLSMLLLATAVFVAGSQLIATPIAQCIYCGAIALNGASLAFFGLAQQLSWNGKLYWRVPFEAGTPFASFVNRNNAAGFLNLCLAGAIGLCVWAVSRTAVSNRGDNYPSKPEDRWRLAGNQLVRFVASLDAITLTAFTSSIVIMAGILCSLSRGGWISLTVGAMVTLMAALVSQRGGRPRLSWLAVAALAGLLLVGWLGKSEVVQQRLSTLLDYRQTLTDRRLPHWQDGFHAARDFWRAGSGLGTYRYVYSLYQERSDDAWYYHAENQYLESLVDAGVPGLLLLLTAIGLMGLVCWRLLREPPHRTSYALGIAATFALASQSVHAVFDFGLYIPANMVLFGLLCGAAAGQAVRLEADRDGRLKPTWTAWISRLIILPPVTGVTRTFVPLLACAVFVASFEVRKVAAVEAAVGTTKSLSAGEVDVTEERLARSIRQLTAALQRRPDDAEGQLLLARLWTERYRLDALQADPSPFAKRLSDTGDLRSWLLYLQHNHRSADFAAVQASASVVHNLTHSVRHLLLARDACPILPRVHLALAELAVAIDRDDHRHLERAYSLASWDQQFLLHIAAFASQSERPDLAIECYRRCLELHPEMTSWRYELAMRFRTEGMSRKALEQAQLCVGMEPDNQTYRALLNELLQARTARAAELGAEG